MTVAANAANRTRSVSRAAAVILAARGPDACFARPTMPPGMNTAHCSMSTARTNAASAQALSTAIGVQSCSTGPATLTTKNAAAPNSANASAAAFHTDMNDKRDVATRIQIVDATRTSAECFLEGNCGNEAMRQ